MVKLSSYAALTAVPRADDPLLVLDRHDTSMSAQGTEKLIAVSRLSAAQAVYNIADPVYGAKCDGNYVTDAATTSGSAALTSATAAFTAADVGKLVWVSKALDGTADLTTTIAAYVSATQVTLAVSAGATLTGQSAVYGTDDSAAWQAAINAAQAAGGNSSMGAYGTVLHPGGISCTGTEMLVQAPIRITGGPGAVLKTIGAAAFNFNNTYISANSSASWNTGLEIDHLLIDASGGHIFYNTNLNGFKWHDLHLEVRDANHGAWNSTNSSANQLSGTIERVRTYAHGATRTVETWHVLSSIGGGMAFIRVRDCQWGQADHDTSQFYVYFECTGTHNYTNEVIFDSCVWDAAYGGCVKLLSTQASTFRDCTIVDTFGSPAPGSSMYYIGASAGGSQWASQKIRFQNCNRDLQGPNGSSTWDIECESTTDAVTVDNYEVRDIPGVSTFFPYFNFHGCTNVVVNNCPDAVITNSPTSGVTLGPAGNISFTGSLTGATQPNVALPGDQGYLAWTLDPSAIQGHSTVNSGTLYVAAFYLRLAELISTVSVWLGVASAGTTSGENFAGLWNSSGTLLTGSADQTSNWGSGAIGVKNAALTTPQSLTAGWYWLGVLANWTTTGVQLGRGSAEGAGTSLAANAGTSGGSIRYGSIAAFGTSLSSFTPSSLSATGPIALWAAVK